VLLVEDSEDDALLLLRELRRGGYEPTCERVSTPEEMERALADAGGEPWEVVLSDYYMPSFRAPEALALLRRLGYDTPFIVVSGKIGEDAAVAMMRAGAQDYVTKDNMARLCPAIERELREAALRQERVRAEEALNRNREAQRLLAEAGAVLSSSLDYRATLESLARLAVPRLADWCAVDMVEEDGSTERLAVAHQDPEKVAWAHELQERYPPDPEAPRWVPKVLRTGRPEFYPEITDEMLVAVARDEGHLRIMREIGFTSAIVVPLVARERALGAITLVSAESGRRYEESDLGLAEELARRAALAVENAGLYEAAQREISERKRSEKALRQSEELYRSVVEQAAENIFLVDAETKRVLEANAALHTSLGYTMEELRRMTLYDIVAHDRESIDRHIEHILQEGRHFIGERRYRRKDGTLADVEVSVSAVPYGTTRALCIVAHDVTGRKEAEEALKESETRYRTLVEQVPAITYIEALDVGEEPEWNMLYVSPQVEALLGYSPKEWLSTPDLWSDLLHPGDQERVLIEDARTERTGEPFRVEYRMFARDGRIMWVRDEAVLVRDESGEPLFWQGIIFDITESKLAEEALQQSEERYRAVVEQATDGIFLLDVDARRILQTNPSLQQMLGYAAEELRGMEVYELIAHPREDVEANLGRTLREGRRFVGERKYRRRDGGLVDVEVGVSVIQHGVGKVVCAVVRDITGRKQSEEALREVREAERNRIARDLHDDILQDIVYALQEIQIMQITSEDGGDAALEDTAGALRRSVEGLRAAIFELRLTERLGQPFVSSLEALVDVNRRMARRRYELELDVEEGFPRALSEKASQELVRIIQEALANVRRHSGARRVGMKLWLAGDLGCAEVSDDGRGFDIAQTEAGMGWHSMHHRARELGGELQIESEPGRGTRVRFRGPVSRLVEN